MNSKNFFHEYLRQPGAKPLWRIAYEAGAGSVQFLRQVGQGHRKASESLARGIEMATDGAVKRQDLRPDIFDAVWGEGFAVQQRMRLAATRPEDVRREYLGLETVDVTSEAGQ